MYASQRFTVSTAFPVSVITGGVVSTTFTILVTCVPGLSEKSVTSYVTIYEPVLVISTVLFTRTEAVIFPSSLSFAVAHASIYGVLASCVNTQDPVSMITGISQAITFTVLVTSVAVFHDRSVTLYVIV